MAFDVAAIRRDFPILSARSMANRWSILTVRLCAEAAAGARRDS